jgi:hypothetical protein
MKPRRPDINNLLLTIVFLSLGCDAAMTLPLPMGPGTRLVLIVCTVTGAALAGYSWRTFWRERDAWKDSQRRRQPER